jgi:hypothetical protein
MSGNRGLVDALALEHKACDAPGTTFVLALHAGPE